MNRCFRYILPAVVIGFLVGVGASSVSAQGVLGEILKRMDDHNKALTSLKGSITMSKFNPQLGEGDVYEGTIIYLPGGRTEKQIYVRIDWTKPKESLSIANGEYRLYNERNKQMIVGKVDQAQKNAGAGNALAFMSMNRAQLRENYTVQYAGDETVSGGVKAFHLTLTPKTSAGYKSADLWVDVNGMPVQAKILERNNDTTTVLLYNLQKNATVKASLFRIEPPKGTKIIRG